MTIDGNDSPDAGRLFFGEPEQKNNEEKTNKRNLGIFSEAIRDMPSTEGSFIKRQRVEYRRARLNKAKFPKIYPQVDGLEIVGKLVAIHGKEYPIKTIAEGNFHKVYEFTAQLPVKPDNEQKSLILKSFNQRKDPKSLLNVKKEDITAYKQFLKDGVPQPKVYIRPDQFEDEVDTQYGDFWIVEKMDGHASIESQFVLDFVKEWLTKSVLAEREIIPDFYPRNVMVKGKQCFIVDPSFPQEKDEWLDNIYGFVIAWSNGKQVTYDFLTSEFPKCVKGIFDTKLVQDKKKYGDKFPVTNQTKV